MENVAKEITVQITADSTQLDVVKEKTLQCKALLQEIKELAGSIDIKITANVIPNKK